MDTFPVVLNFVALAAIAVWTICGFLGTIKHHGLEGACDSGSTTAEVPSPEVERRPFARRHPIFLVSNSALD